MQLSGKFDQEAIKYFKDAKKLHYVHGWHNKAFALSIAIKTSIEPSKLLNANLINKDIFSFSFVRHPYTRYKRQYIFMKQYSYKKNLLVALIRKSNEAISALFTGLFRRMRIEL